MSERLLTSRCTSQGRQFRVELLRMANGWFASVSEDSQSRIGAISVAVSTEGRTIHSTSLIPDRRGGMLAGMIGDTLVGKTDGIAIISLRLKSEVDSDSMKTLINEVRKLVKQD